MISRDHTAPAAVSPKSPIGTSRHRWSVLGPVLILLLGMVATTGTSLHMMCNATERRDADLASGADHITKEIELGLRSYTGMLQAGAAFLESSEYVTRDEWRQFTQRLKLENNFPGFVGLAVVKSVERESVGEFQAWMRRYDDPEFTVQTPWDDGETLDPAIAQTPAFIITYHEPAEQNRSLWGTDVSLRSENREVYIASDREGAVRVSKPLQLLQLDRPRSCIMVFPVTHMDREANAEPKTWPGATEAVPMTTKGWVAAPIALDRFFAELNGINSGRFAFNLTPVAGGPAVDFPPRPAADDLVTAELDLSRNFEIDGQQYTVDVRPLDVRANQVDRSEATMLFVGGLVITGLITAIACVLSRTNDRAEKLALVMTDSLARSEREQRLLAERAEAAHTVKSQFIANMSHEIRTPITAILGYADVLREQAEATQNPSADLVEAVGAITSSGGHLLTLINDILDMSQIESGAARVTATQTELGPLLAESVRMVQRRAHDRGLTLHVSIDAEVPERITTDAQRCRQILLNLLSNSVKFTDDGEIAVQVSRDENHLLIRVCDTGVGIAPDDLGRLFEAFSQVDDSPTRRFEGTGLGLAISQRYARIMGGGIRVTSTVGEGSVFTFTLPLSESDAASPPLTQSKIDELLVRIRPQRATERFVSIATAARAGAVTPGDSEAGEASPRGAVLVVDDSTDNRRLIVHFLRGAGWTITTAEHGREAVDRVLAGDVYDVIVMDMQMPVMDGPTAVGILREAGVRTPILALTANASLDDRHACLEAGFDVYLTKPVTPQALRDAVARFAEQGRVDATPKAA